MVSQFCKITSARGQEPFLNTEVVPLSTILVVGIQNLVRIIVKITKKLDIVICERLTHDSTTAQLTQHWKAWKH